MRPNRTKPEKDFNSHLGATEALLVPHSALVLGGGDFGDTPMPLRFLRPGITTSKHWDACSWMAQSFYIRILTLVDDFGRYEADPVLLKSHAFPLREDVTTNEIKCLQAELEKNTLVCFYEAEGKLYLAVNRWEERPRAKKSKCPEPPANKCLQMFANVSLARAGTPEGEGDNKEGGAGGNHRPLSGAQLILREKELERVEAKMQKIRDSVDSHRDLEPKDKHELKRLKGRAEELKQMLELAA